MEFGSAWRVPPGVKWPHYMVRRRQGVKGCLCGAPQMRLGPPDVTHYRRSRGQARLWVADSRKHGLLPSSRSAQ
jgi:hypothetical protein